MADIRTALTEALDKYEGDTAADTPVVENTPAVVEEAPVVENTASSQETAEQRARDEQGRFAKQQAEAAQQAAQVVQAPPVQRPSTWKKEYWPLYDKLAQGQALTPDEAKKLADYTNQRENEFKSGVSTYKAEAEQAREIQGAMAPFMQDLQRYNIKPGEWISNLGNAHRILALGSPQEKLQAFHRLARDYNIDLGQMAQGAQAPQIDPQLQWLTEQLNQTKGMVQQWQSAQEQREQQELLSQIDRVKLEKGSNGQLLRPHFDEVKAQMSGLLSAGIAQDLPDAYEKAVRMNDQLWQQQQAIQAQAATAQRVAQSQAVVQKAKASAVSPRSASPSATGDTAAKGRRAALEASLEESGVFGGGRV